MKCLGNVKGVYYILFCLKYNFFTTGFLDCQKGVREDKFFYCMRWPMCINGGGWL